MQLIHPHIAVHRHARSRLGFTMVELMVVLICITTLLGFTTVRMTGILGSAQNVSAKMLVQDAYKDALAYTLENEDFGNTAALVAFLNGSTAMTTPAQGDAATLLIANAQAAPYRVRVAGGKRYTAVEVDDPGADFPTLDVGEVGVMVSGRTLLIASPNEEGITSWLMDTEGDVDTGSDPGDASSLPTVGEKPTAGSVSVTGATTNGSVLTATATGTWTPGTPAAGATEWEWRRCDANGDNCTGIDGANASAYTLTDSDAGYRLKAVATSANVCLSGCGYARASSVLTAVITNVAPTAGTIILSGTFQQGELVSAAQAGWTEGYPAAAAPTWTWSRCDSAGANCTLISGATSSTYTVVLADVNGTLKASASATNTCPVGTTGCGTATATSSASTVVIPPYRAPTAGTPALSGTAWTGSILTAATGAGWDLGYPSTGSWAYQWQSCDTAGNNCANIAGATSSQYTIGVAYANTKIRVQVTRTNTCAGPCGSATGTSATTLTVVGPLTYVGGMSATSSGAKTSSLAIAYPTGTTTGDVLVLAVATSGGSTGGTFSFSNPGWTLVQRIDNSNKLGVAIYHKASGGESSVTISTTTASYGLSAMMMTFRNATNGSFQAAIANMGMGTTTSTSDFNHGSNRVLIGVSGHLGANTSVLTTMSGSTCPGVYAAAWSPALSMGQQSWLAGGMSGVRTATNSSTTSWTGQMLSIPRRAPF